MRFTRRQSRGWLPNAQVEQVSRMAKGGGVAAVSTVAKPLPEPQLPLEVKNVLNDFLEATRSAFGEQLRSMILFGSAAEGKLRPTSDVNVVVVLSAFDQAGADQLSQPLRTAHAAIQLRPMFVLEAEIADAARWFAPKFADILRRRVVLYGMDSFSTVSVPRGAEVRQLKQQLLNITLRLRAAYVARSAREEQLCAFLADSIGPLRSSAAALFELDGRPATSPQAAFEALGGELALPTWGETLSLLSTIQEGRLIPQGTGPRAAFQLLEFIRLLRARVETLFGEGRLESL